MVDAREIKVKANQHIIDVFMSWRFSIRERIQLRHIVKILQGLAKDLKKVIAA